MKAWFDWRADDPKHWIPAFAGMTARETGAVMPANAGIQQIRQAQHLYSGA
jgi:hypothetical protein